MSISVDLTNKYSEEKNKEQLVRINDLTKIKPPVEESTEGENESSSNIDEFIESQGWVPPYEYYNTLKQSSSVKSNKEEGFFNVAMNSSEIDTSDELGYFWLEDFKTWCRFVYGIDYNNNAGFNIVLTIWNGKDGWIYIPNFIVGESSDSRYIQYKDKYGIAKYQQKLIYKACDTPKNTADEYIYGARGKNEIWFSKGWCQSPIVDDYGLPSSEPLGANGYAYNFKQMDFLTFVKAVRLQKTTKYTINKPGTFITNRWSSAPCFYKRSKPVLSTTDTSLVYDSKGPESRYMQTNHCVPISTGIPCLWRLPTGELALCATFRFNSDPGSAYHYEVGMNDEVRRFRKVYEQWRDGVTYGLSSVGSAKVLGSDYKAASKWLNETCASFFGDGRDKTIEKDWLREYKITESNNASVSNYDNMLDSSLTFEQHNINKENSMKCSFTVNRPVVTTETIERVDYAKKW